MRPPVRAWMAGTVYFSTNPHFFLSLLSTTYFTMHQAIYNLLAESSSQKSSPLVSTLEQVRDPGARSAKDATGLFASNSSIWYVY
mmetsp:Transcript_9898/g.11443  ORF Transcript_9898/g.11443 Transcript_9898/m.11443 type:complete len:85 (+) Transcript_9898:246-500(+)